MHKDTIISYIISLYHTLSYASVFKQLVSSITACHADKQIY